MADTVQQIKDRLSIVDVVSQYVKLERSGASVRARCPFHTEKTPSFFVSAERGTYHCFGCGVGGDLFSFVQAIEGLDFKGALKVLADKAGVELVYSRGEKEAKDERDHLFELLEAATIFYASRLTPEAVGYLKERGINETTIQLFRLGWAGNEWSELSDYLKTKSAGGGSSSRGKFTDKELLEAGVSRKSEGSASWRITDKFRNRIIFPIADSAGRVIGFSGRTFGSHASPEAPKYLNSPETPLFHKSRILYGFDKAKLPIRKHNCAVLVEGQMDLLASHQAGWGNTVAVSGTAFTPEHAALIRRMTDNLVIALDADEAGIKAAGRAARAALQGGLNVKVARLPDGLDPADLILRDGKEAWSAVIRDAKDIITFLLDVLEEHTKGKDGFRRGVETAILPFLVDVRSPIAREQYVREIANRLGVSETAVSGALDSVPSVPPPRAGVAQEKRSPVAASRAKQAFSILLWQVSLAKPTLDTIAFEEQLEDAIGREALEGLRKLPDGEHEALRFSAEVLYAASQNIQREADALLRVLLEERLRGELAEVAENLKRAETAGDETEIDRLQAVNKVLTNRIAQLHAVG